MEGHEPKPYRYDGRLIEVCVHCGLTIRRTNAGTRCWGRVNPVPKVDAYVRYGKPKRKKA